MSFRPARLDLVARSLTGAFFCALTLAVLFALTGPRPMIGLAAAMAGIAAGCALLAPRAYVIEDGGLTVRRAARRAARRGPAARRGGRGRGSCMGARLLGSGGLFGYQGMYRPRRRALRRRPDALATAPCSCVGSEGGALVSPDDREALLALVNPDE